MKNFYAFIVTLFVFGLIIIFGLRDYSSKRAQEEKGRVKESSESYLNQEERRIAELVESGKPIKCSFARDTENNKIGGTLYMDTGRIRVDLNGPDINDVQRLSHTLFKDELVYTWYDDMLVGMTVRAPIGVEETTESTQSDYEKSIYAGLMMMLNEINYDCDSWEKDEIIFNLPLNVKFVDAETFVQAYSTAICKKCDEETEEASRLLCRKMLQCN